MIKKNTKIIFEGNGEEKKELVGGVPLSEGEIVNVKNENSEEFVNYKVIKKEVEFIFEGEDQVSNIKYILKKV